MRKLDLIAPAFGPSTSRNFTPEANGLPAGFTLDQFIEVFNKG